MSYISASLTVTISPSEAPDKVDSLEDIESRWNDEMSCFAMFRDSSLRGWLLRTIGGYSAVDLDYLGQDGAILAKPSLDRAITAIDALLQSIDVDPICFLSKLGIINLADYYYEPESSRHADEEMVRFELRLPPAIPKPQGYYEDGSSWAYMLGFLKSHQVVLRYAQANELCVLFGQTKVGILCLGL